jgi:glycosyltransferase involved in cell wall biosynthesis
MRVSYFERERFPGLYSIERLFEAIRRALPPGIDVTTVNCPTPAHGRWWLPVGLLRAALGRDDVNHIVGDIHYVALALPAQRTILTIHDINRLHELSGLRKTIFQWLYFGLPMRRCRFITTISKCTRDHLVNLYPWAAAKIHVIPNCTPARFAPSPKPFCRKRPRLLQLGTRQNKNLERIAEALEGRSCILHVIGALTRQQRQALSRCRVTYINEVDISDEELLAAYREADIVLFASVAEGFGLPIIEAQSVGRPVLTSDRSPMREVAGDGACLVDPCDTDAIRAGIQRLVDDDDYREELVNKGFDNARRFQAEEVAKCYLRLYEQVAPTLAAAPLVASESSGPRHA